MGNNKFKRKEIVRYKLQYSRTKAAVAFMLSVLFSVFLTPYFDRYLYVILDRAKLYASSVADNMAVEEPQRKIKKRIQTQELRAAPSRKNSIELGDLRARLAEVKRAGSKSSFQE